MPSVDVTRLEDGRLVFTSADGDWGVLEGGIWSKVPGVTLGMFTDSKPLTDAEIADLKGSGLYPGSEDEKK